MFRILGIILFCLVLCIVSTIAQADDQCTQKTQVIIIGTIHSRHYENPSYSPDILKEIILSIKPDVILNELPLSLVDSDGRPIEKIRRKGNSGGPESWAADIAAQQLGIKQIPFDRPDRNEFYRKTNYFKRQKEYNQQLNSWFEELYAKEPNSIDIQTIMLIGEAIKAQGALSTQKLTTPKLINSELYDCVMRIKHASGNIVPEILKKYSASQSMINESTFFRDVWSERNKLMANSIVTASGEYKGKKLVVITGAEHRYILRDLLKDNANIELKEYWEIEQENRKLKDGKV